MSAIQTSALSKQYRELTAVEHLDLNISHGELFSLLGVNGAGKTTTIKMLSCLTKPTAGDALVCGYSITKDPQRVKQLIGVSPQETAVAPALSVKENLELICGIYGFTKEKTAAKIKELSVQLDLNAVLQRKAGKLSLKIYQPFNTRGYKWCSKMDSSVIGLWTKIPKTGDRVVICSSLKDALCVSCQLHIPTLCLQGEGYNMSETAINELKRRFNKVFIAFDVDKPGVKDAQKLSEETGFINVVPDLGTEKDFSDAFKKYGKEWFISKMSNPSGFK